MVVCCYVTGGKHLPEEGAILGRTGPRIVGVEECTTGLRD
jgi:hypothetical protein